MVLASDLLLLRLRTCQPFPCACKAAVWEMRNPLEKPASFQTFFVCFRELRVSAFFRNTIETAQPAELQAEDRPHVPALAHPPPERNREQALH